MSTRFITRRMARASRPAGGGTLRQGTAAGLRLISDDELQLLTQIGFASVMRGRIDEARPIFDALAEFAPDNAASAIGIGLGALIRGDLDMAIRTLKKDGVTKPVGSAEAKAVLLIALQLAGRLDEAEFVKRDVMRREGPARELAGLLG